jgi:hypothetical protein
MRANRTKAWALALCFFLACPTITRAQTQSDPELAVGIQQVREGEFEQGLVTLENVANRMTAKKGQEATLARVYTYLAVAYMGLAQKEKAKAKFVEAWKADMGMTLSPKEFPPSVIAAFEQAKSEAATAGRRVAEEPAPAAATTPSPTTGAQAATPPATPTAGPNAAVTAEKKGGGHTGLILGIVGGAGAIAGIAAAKGGGGSGGNSPPPPTTPVATITFLGSSPSPGSTLPASQFALTTSFSVTYSADVTSARVAVRLVAGSTECAGTTNPNVSLFKGQPVVVQLSIAQPTLWPSCSAPVTTSVVHAYLYDNATAPPALLGQASFNASYSFR